MGHWLTVFLSGLLATLALQVRGYASESRLGGIVLSDLTTTSACYRYYCDAKSNLIQYHYPCRFTKSGQLALGFGEGAWDTVSGLASAVWHIDQTAAGLWNAVTHPLQTLDALSLALAEYADAAFGGDPRAIGRGVFELAAFGVPMLKAAYASTTIRTVSDTAQAAARLHVFWSGGRLAEDAARAFAAVNNGIVLGDTAAGRALAEATKGLPWSEARSQWVALSEQFARTASGEVNVFHASAGIALDSIWVSEYRVLIQNPAVTKINYHVVMPDSTVIKVP